MAVGDIIIAHRVNSFQPSAGTELIITMVFTDNVNSGVNIRESTGSTDMRNYGGQTDANNSVWTTTSQKFGITNTNYFFNSSTASGGFTAIQIK